jgi:translation initiation factor 2 subunit 1
MHFKLKGFPKESSIVLCKVKKIQKTTVFVELENYKNVEGIIHISEISPGRIRTIRDYVKEGKKVVCKVLRKNEKYGNLDLSLRRVTTGQKLEKLKEIKREEKCEKIIESASKKLKLKFEEVYRELDTKIRKHYSSISEGFQDLAEEDTISLEEIGIEKKLAKTLEELIHSRLKPQEIKISKNILIKCPETNGIKIIKDSIKKITNAHTKENLKTNYISAPKYNLTITSQNPKKAEEDINSILESLKEELIKKKAIVEIEKKKK